MSRKAFVKLCLDTLEKELRPAYIADWKRLGMSCDFEMFYTTIDKHSQKISQKSFIDLYKQDKAYRKFAPVMVCPKCKTAVAQVELEDLKRTSKLNYVKCNVEGGKSITFATTRPELMMACIAITVHPEDKRFKHLVGKKATIPGSHIKVPIIADDITDPEFGSGVVYWCPYSDSVSAEFAEKHPDLKVIHILDSKGTLNERAGKYHGMKSEEARKAVIADWKEAGALVKQETIQQVVNVHERCGTPIEFIAMHQWFIRLLDNRKRWLTAGNRLKWFPKHMKNRYDNWINGLKYDWNISRQIPFGVPFPVWYCKDCSEIIIANEKDLPVDPTTDKPPVEKCPECGKKEIIPEEDIFNTWSTSSLTPQIAASLVPERYDDIYPMTMRPQAHDIISFWLFNTVVKSQLHNKFNPWRDCVISGWALDSHGKKMSKSKGNVIHPQEIIQKYGADSLRFWAASSKLGDDMPYQEKDLVTGQKLITKLWNSARFVFMNLEDYKKQKPDLEIIDKWILAKLTRVIKEATKSFEKYEYFRTKADTEVFFWRLFCENYLEIVKHRIYSNTKSKAAAQYALYEVMLSVLKLFAPIMPHITEELYQLFYQKQEKEKSIHITKWPEPYLSDKQAETLGDILVRAVSAARKAKTEKNVSLKTPVKQMVVHANITEKEFELIKPDLVATATIENLEFKKDKEFAAKIHF